MTIQFNSPVAAEKPAGDRSTFEAVPFLWQERQSLYARFGKRAIDIALVTLSLPVVVPFIGLLALLVALDGGRPFYRQKRLGRDGKAFSILKLRTMISDADRVLNDYLEDNPEARGEWEHKQKLTVDPRITWTGRLLRKTSLDELPQVWNVLKGEMSLVGPRPMMLDQQVLYSGTHYYHLRPGMTGIWQVSDRNQTSFASRAVFDNRYAAELSLLTDLKILARTIGVVMRATGM